jgi:vitamin K-dependent gamma-carboxylase
MGTRRWLGTPVDAAGVACFRIAFGLVMAFSAVRFMAKGWIDALFVEPRFHFAYPGMEWLSPWPAPWLYAHFALMTAAALGVALGFCYRSSALLLFLTFTSAELYDQTYYLNHYYLASLIAGLCCVLPLQRAWSVDAWRAGRRGGTVARAVPLLLRAQLAIVYLFAGLAKLDGDWLLRGEPLRTWLQAHAELPLLGPWLQLPETALALSWTGAAFDLSIAGWLCLRRTRLPAYLAVIAFHLATALLFPIGIFPWLMIALTPVFFAHDWPRGPAAGTRPSAGQPLGLLASAALGAYLLIQIALPLRHLAYPGAVNWSEEGFRFAWRVMLIEKTGSVTLRVRDLDRGEELALRPRDELTARQHGQMVTQPALIAAYARHVAERYASQGRRVAVYADAWASLNGRPAQRLIDPSADLAQPRPWLAADPAIVPLAANQSALRNWRMKERGWRRAWVISPSAAIRPGMRSSGWLAASTASARR